MINFVQHPLLLTHTDRNADWELIDQRLIAHQRAKNRADWQRNVTVRFCQINSGAL